MLLAEVKKNVFAHKPKLAEIIKRYGNMSVFDYFNSVPYSFSSVLRTERQTELLQVIKDKISGLFDENMANDVIDQLKRYYFVSTAEHHGIICHPFFFNSTLCRFLTQQERKETSVLSLTCGSISLNNSSFPRGLIVHDQSLKEERFHLFSGQRKHAPVFGLEAYLKNQKLTVLHRLEIINLSEVHKEKIRNIIDEIIFSEQVLKQKYFSDQISLINHALWKLLPGHNEMNLIHIEQEEIVRQLLLRYHLINNSLIFNLLFSPTFVELFIKYFDGITGAFSSQIKRGSVLFWGINDGSRVSLWLKDTMLVSEDQSIKIRLEPDIIREHLENKTIMPTMALSYIILSFYYGLTCGGGFSQINYLGDMKLAYLKFLEEAGYTKEQELVNSLKTDIFCGEFVLATIASGRYHCPAFSLDLILADTNSLNVLLLDVSKKMSLATVIDGMMPEYHKIITGAQIPLINITLPKPLLYV